MKGKEIYDKYGIKKNETITETTTFEKTPYSMDIKIIIPENENDTPWTEAILFCNNQEICVSEIESEFFQEWELYDNNKKFCVNVITE